MKDISDEQVPIGGTIIRYEYLWIDESLAGEVEGEKGRPVAVVLSKTSRGKTVVLPITHAEPYDKSTALEIPEDERIASGLDNERSWIIFSELNSFNWPSKDIKTVPGNDENEFIYGEFSFEFFEEVLARFHAVIKGSKSRPVDR